MSRLLRAGLVQEDQQEVELAQELELVEHYLEIEKLRLGERLDSTVRVESGLGRTRVPSLVLLPVVENAIQYGIAPRTSGGRLEIRIARDGEQVLLEVTDDGPGFDEEALRELEGSGSPGGGGERRKIGLANTKRRLEMLHGSRGTFEVSNRQEGTGARVRLGVPISSSEPPAEGEKGERG